MIISLLVAASLNNVIGKDNKLLWHLPADLKFFKNTTWAMPVVMGRKTFESMGNKPLAGRLNIVITRQLNLNEAGAIVVNNLEEALLAAKQAETKEVFIIGGGEIYKESIDIADRIYITRVHETFEGDTFFPAINEDQWKLVSDRDHQKDEKHAYDISFQLWEKK